MKNFSRIDFLVWKIVLFVTIGKVSKEVWNEGHLLFGWSWSSWTGSILCFFQRIWNILVWFLVSILHETTSIEMIKFVVKMLKKHELSKSNSWDGIFRRSCCKCQRVVSNMECHWLFVFRWCFCVKWSDTWPYVAPMIFWNRITAYYNGCHKMNSFAFTSTRKCVSISPYSDTAVISWNLICIVVDKNEVCAFV